MALFREDKPFAELQVCAVQDVLQFGVDKVRQAIAEELWLGVLANAHQELVPVDDVVQRVTQGLAEHYVWLVKTHLLKKHFLCSQNQISNVIKIYYQLNILPAELLGMH